MADFRGPCRDTAVSGILRGVQLGRRWMLREVRTGSSILVVTEQIAPSITFEVDGRVHGSDGENLFYGLYRFNSAQGALRVDHELSTVRAFADPTAEQRLVVAASRSLFARSGPPIEVRTEGDWLELRTHEHVLVYS